MRFITFRNAFLPLIDFRPFLSPSFSNIGIGEIEIAVKLIPT